MARPDKVRAVAEIEDLCGVFIPDDGLEPYLGAWGHMLAVSEDLVDLVHTHPFIADGGPTVQFNLVFPRPGLFRIWTQFQRQGVVNTLHFDVPVRALQ